MLRAVDVTAIRARLDELRAGDDAAVVLATGLDYTAGRPVHVHVRKRGGRYDITDGAAAVDLAGRRSGWLDVATDAVAAMGMNINRRGVVFVTGFPRRDLVDLAMRLAECSRVVYVSLLEATDGG